MRRRCARCGRRHAGTHGGWFTVRDLDQLGEAFPGADIHGSLAGVGRIIQATTRKGQPLLVKCQTFVDPGPWWRRK